MCSEESLSGLEFVVQWEKQQTCLEDCSASLVIPEYLLMLNVTAKGQWLLRQYLAGIFFFFKYSIFLFTYSCSESNYKFFEGSSVVLEF